MMRWDGCSAERNNPADAGTNDRWVERPSPGGEPLCRKAALLAGSKRLPGIAHGMFRPCAAVVDVAKFRRPGADQARWVRPGSRLLANQ